jgi:hypothetical protein
MIAMPPPSLSYQVPLPDGVRVPDMALLHQKEGVHG